MPGVVKSLMCGPGDAVEEGSTLVTLEAMKMQNPLFAPKTGVVSGAAMWVVAQQHLTSLSDSVTMYCCIIMKGSQN